MAQQKICPVCQTAQDAAYTYCRNCGAHLPVAATPPYTPPYTPPAPQPQPVAYTPPQPQGNEAPDPTQPTLCGVTEPEAATFIGKNCNDFIFKFRRFEQGASASWNWPQFLFSFFLGLPFVWFFYRKMYKAGSLILVASTFLNILSAVCASKYLSFILYPLSSGSAAWGAAQDAATFAEGYSDFIMQTASFWMLYLLGILAIAVIQLVLCFILPIFANKMYHTYCTKKLLKMRNEFGGLIPPVALRALGNVNTGLAVALGIIIPILIWIVQTLSSTAAILSVF